MGSRTASCSCGQLRIEVQGDPQGVGVCHCLACQRRTGSVFAALAGFAAPYQVSRHRHRVCPGRRPGLQVPVPVLPGLRDNLFHTEEGHEQHGVAVAVGAFADPELPAARGLGLRLPPAFLGAAAGGDQDLRQGPELTRRGRGSSRHHVPISSTTRNRASPLIMRA